MKKTKLFLAALALTASLPAALAQTETAETTQASATSLKVNVKGMVCDFCARAVTKVFGKNDAVEQVDVDLDNGIINVDLKPGTQLTDDEVEKLVKRSGYAMVSVERETS